jgi:hypothetical protein
VPNLVSKAKRHLERVGPVVVSASREIAELIHEQARRRTSVYESQSMLRQVRSEPANAHELACMVVDRRGHDMTHALPRKLGCELAA